MKIKETSRVTINIVCFLRLVTSVNKVGRFPSRIVLKELAGLLILEVPVKCLEIHLSQFVARSHRARLPRDQDRVLPSQYRTDLMNLLQGPYQIPLPVRCEGSSAGVACSRPIVVLGCYCVPLPAGVCCKPQPKKTVYPGYKNEV